MFTILAFRNSFKELVINWTKFKRKDQEYATTLFQATMITIPLEDPSSSISNTTISTLNSINNSVSSVFATRVTPYNTLVLILEEININSPHPSILSSMVLIFNKQSSIGSNRGLNSSKVVPFYWVIILCFQHSRQLLVSWLTSEVETSR